jgi:PPOX class probable F420-dependent enzyme
LYGCPVPKTLSRLSAAGLSFLAERHLATFSSLRADGSLHVVPVGFSWDPVAGLARVITTGANQKARNAERGSRAALCQADGARWLTLEGACRVLSDPAAVADAEARYALRYRQPRVNPARVVLVVEVDRILGSAAMVGAG